MEEKQKASAMLFRSCLTDFCISLKILFKFLAMVYLCWSVIQIDYTRLLNLERSGNNSLTKASNVSYPRIFCLIFTSVERHDYIAIHGLSTWIKNCDRYLFVSNEMHSVLEPLVIKNRYRWGSILISFNYVYSYFADEMDWLLKVNDDSYVILENLRKMLLPHSPNEPINFGCKMKDNENQTYMHGGYVLSREALHRLVAVSFKNASMCYLQDSSDDDQELSRCLRNVGVVAGDSRDDMDRQRFVPFSPEEYMVELKRDKREWYLNRSYYEINATTRQMSKDVIYFDSVNAPTMATLDYYIYKQRIFGRNKAPPNATEQFLAGNSKTEN